jgi:hypothetical protein
MIGEYRTAITYWSRAEAFKVVEKIRELYSSVGADVRGEPFFAKSSLSKCRGQ